MLQQQAQGIAQGQGAPGPRLMAGGVNSGNGSSIIKNNSEMVDVLLHAVSSPTTLSSPPAPPSASPVLLRVCVCVTGQYPYATANALLIEPHGETSPPFWVLHLLWC